MRALADPNVLVAAAISKGGACARLLLLAEQGAFQLVASSELFNELEEVLLRTKFRRYVQGCRKVADPN